MSILPSVRRGVRTFLAAALLLIAASAHAGWLRPRWTRAKPHFETRDGRRVAVAAGKAKDLNVSLARSAAEERARADLLRLLQDKPPFADVEGRVRLAAPAAFYDDGGGVVYVRLELDVTDSSKP
jgi:hypothetical protein